MTTLTIRGHQFTFLGVEPYTRQDGSKTFLNCWHAVCATKGCGNAWRFKTPASDDPSRYPPGGSTHNSYNFDNRICQACKPPRQVKPGSYASRQRITDDEVATMREIASTYTGDKRQLYQVLGLTFSVSAGTAREIVKGRRR